EFGGVLLPFLGRCWCRGCLRRGRAVGGVEQGFLGRGGGGAVSHQGGGGGGRGGGGGGPGPGAGAGRGGGAGGAGGGGGGGGAGQHGGGRAGGGGEGEHDRQGVPQRRVGEREPRVHRPQDCQPAVVGCGTGAARPVDDVQGHQFVQADHPAAGRRVRGRDP